MSALGIIDQVIYGPSWYGKTGDKVTQTLNLLGILASLFLFWSGTRKIKIARFNRVLPLAAAGFLLISILWSSDQRVTLTQGTLYIFTVVGAFGLVEAWDSDALLEQIALMCGLCAVSSVVYFLMFPAPGDFIGIFGQKNVLGQVMAAGVLAALHGARIRGGRRFRCICIIALCTTVAFMSKSTTSILTIFMLFLLDLLGRLYLRGGFLRFTSICLAIGCVSTLIFFLMNEAEIFELLGKDATLTGRTLFWPYVIDSILERPLLGWGYYGFWSPQNPIALQIAEAIKGDNWYTFIIPNAHNAILEFLLEIGFVGTSFFLFLWARNLVMAMKCMNGAAKQCGLSSMLVLLGILVIGVSEDVLLAAHQVWTSLFFMMGFICEKNLWLARAASKQRMARSAALRSAADPVGLA
jgi:exopolysaccharide production protein ExoQ